MSLVSECLVSRIKISQEIVNSNLKPFPSQCENPMEREFLNAMKMGIYLFYISYRCVAITMTVKIRSFSFCYVKHFECPINFLHGVVSRVNVTPCRRHRAPTTPLSVIHLHTNTKQIFIIISLSVRKSFRIYIYIYILYVYVCVFVCVGVWVGGCVFAFLARTCVQVQIYVY